MRPLVRRRPSASLVVAAVAVVIAGTGSAVAAALITSKQIKNGTIQLVDISKAARRALQSARGPQGPVGATGAAGPQGIRGPVSTWVAPPRAEVSLPVPAGVPLELRRITDLPAGNWELKFSADVISSFGGEAIVACSVTINASPQASAGVVVGQAAPAIQQVGLAIDTVATSAVPFTPVVTCYQNQSNSPSAVIRGAQLIAMQLGDVTTVP